MTKRNPDGKSTAKSTLERDPKTGRITGGKPPAGFDKHPENSGRGLWKKEDTPRYKLEQMIRLSEVELIELRESIKQPLFERRLADAIINSDWKVVESIINQVYGTPKQTIEQTNIASPKPLEDLAKGK